MEGLSLLFLGLTFLLYMDAFFLYLYNFLAKRETIGRAANYVFLAGFLTQTLSLIFRGVASNHFPGTAAFESFSVAPWFITGGFLLVEFRTRKMKVLGLFASIVVSLFLVQAAAKYSAPGPPIPLLKSPLVELHLTLIGVTAAALTVAGGSSLLYLLQERQMKSKKSSVLVRRLPSLEVLDEVTYQAILFGFPFLTLVIVTGTVRALQLWVISQDVVVLSRLIATGVVWLVYSAYFALRLTIGWGGRKAAVLALTGFLGLILIQFVLVQYLSHLI